jgi:23S rRNA (uracil1939-C5)-methyltransferase
MPQATIESLDHEGRGVAHVDGKVIFIEGALPGEIVEYSSYQKKPRYERAQVTAVLRQSSQRVPPRCRHFDICGGCSMQHLDPVAQTAAKQRVLEDALWHLGRLRPDSVFAPLVGSPWRYRHRARLAVYKVAATGVVLVGFHQHKSSHVADMDSCEVLPVEISRMLPHLRALVGSLKQSDRLPQIEVSVGEQGGVIQRVLVLRHLSPFSAADQALLRGFADAHGVVLYLQSGGPESATLFHPIDAPPLAYSLPEFDIALQFRPTDFTQVNHAVNRILMRRAMTLLAPRPGDRIADLFCGLGNFTLPMARLGAAVVGVEGSAGLIAQARKNAALNGLAERCEFHVADLFEATTRSIAAYGQTNKMLIDPPRDGALAVVKAIAALGQRAPSRILYVSCSPATLARDAAILVNQGEYRLRGAGIANMFPQTSHVESIALFER